jgi:hypothetical protein
MKNGNPAMPDGRCAPGIQEHSLCGMAFDAFESGDADAPVVFAQPGEQVTCQECLALIRYVRSAFRRNRYLGDDA